MHIVLWERYDPVTLLRIAVSITFVFAYAVHILSVLCLPMYSKELRRYPQVGHLNWPISLLAQLSSGWSLAVEKQTEAKARLSRAQQ